MDKGGMIQNKKLKKKGGMVYTYIHPHTYTMQYYAAMRNKDILPFATTWMDLEDIVTLRTLC